MMKKLTTLLVLGALLAACAPAPAPRNTLAVPTTTDVPRPTSAPTAASSATDQIGEALLVYTQSGGILGKHVQWTIYPDGRIEPERGAALKVSPAEIESLKRSLLDQGFITMAMAKKIPSRCADCILMTVVLFQDGQKYELRTDFIDPSSVDKERQIIATLDQLIYQAGGR